MSIWDAAAEKMDMAVDTLLSDTIAYATNGTTFTDLPGYILDDSEALGLTGIDEQAKRYRLKISKALVAKPSQAHRLKCLKKLGTQVYRPTGKQPRDDGRYWICDIEKA